MMPRNEQHKEQQQKSAEHHLRHKAMVIAMHERCRHQREHDRPREDEPPMLRTLRRIECERILPRIFIKSLFQESPLQLIDAFSL